MASNVPMPSAMTEEEVARWLFNIDYPRHAWEEADSGHIDTYLASARAVLALVEAKVREAVDEIRDYSVKAAATCREAEGERARDIASRPDNVMLDILREQHYAWGQKASSYDALVVFIDAIVARVMGKEAT